MVLKDVLPLQYKFNIPGYFASQDFSNFLIIFRSGSYGSLSVESIYTFVCDVNSSVELLTPQSNNFASPLSLKQMPVCM